MVWKRNLMLIVTGLLMVAGVTVLAWNSILFLQSSKEQAVELNNYYDEYENIDTEGLLAEADAYNEALRYFKVLDPYVYEDSAEADPAYWKTLISSPNSNVIGRLIIPVINVDYPIYHSTNEESLSKGVGHLYGSSLPVGGMSTHSILSAHSGMPNSKMFDQLDKVEIGDRIYLNILGRQLAYQVDQIDVVLPEDAPDYLEIEEGRDLITLVTCTPYSVNTHRLLVTARRIPWDVEPTFVVPDAAQTESTWWVIPLVLIYLSIIVFVSYQIHANNRWAKKMKEKKRAAELEEQNNVIET